MLSLSAFAQVPPFPPTDTNSVPVEPEVSTAPALSIFYDGFDTGANTPWTFYQGTHLFTNGVLKLNVLSSNSGQYAYIRTNWSNILVQSSVKLYPNTYAASIGLRYNVTNGANYSAWLYQSGKFSIRKYSNWFQQWMEVATLNVASPDTNTHTIKLSATNNIITANLDGTNTLTYIDASTSQLKTGGIDFAIWNGTTPLATAEFDNVTVYDLNSPLIIAPKIQSMTKRLIKKQGDTITLSVNATGTSPTYKWYFGGGTNPIVGATNNTLTVTNTKTSNAGLYKVTVENAAGSVYATANTTVFTTNILPQCILGPSKATFYWNYDFTNNPSVNGFRIYEGLTSGIYTNTIVVNGQVVTNQITNIVNGVTHYYAIKAKSTNGLESANYSNEILLNTPTYGSLTNFNPNIYFLGSVGYPAIQVKVCPNQSVTFSYTSNIVGPWTVLANVIADEYGNAVYDDVSALGVSSRFYKVTTP